MEENEWMVEMISNEAGLSPDIVRSLVKKKIDEFPSLTENAALKMVATEKGVVPVKKKFKISDINEDIKHLNIVATIQRKFEPRKIMIKGSPSTISNLALKDDTGIINAVIWDTKKVDQIQKDALVGDIISIANAYTRKSFDGEHYEIHLGTNSAIKINRSAPKLEMKQVEGKIDRVSEVTDTPRKYTVRGFMTRLFTNNIFLIRCNICKKRVVNTCDEHGDKAISRTLMISGILDDGMSSIKVSFFDRVADKLLSLSKAEELDDKINDLSFGLYEIDVTGIPNKFNDVISLNARDIRPTKYSL
jgi:ssDNA-binding replication factor A large subunit